MQLLLPRRAESLIRTNLYFLYSTENSSEPRNIGITTKSIEQRFYRHKYEALNGSTHYRHNWIRDVLRRGYEVKTMLIGNVAGNGCKEEIAWIAYGRAVGWRLTNMTDGGEGRIAVCSEETKHRIGDKNRGKTRTDAQKQNMRKPHGPHTREHSINQSIAQTGKKRKPFTEEHLHNMRIGFMTRPPVSEITRNKQKESAKRRWKNYHLS